MCRSTPFNTPDDEALRALLVVQDSEQLFGGCFPNFAEPPPIRPERSPPPRAVLCPEEGQKQAIDEE